jgi:CheY-like chemotaxis protein
MTIRNLFVEPIRVLTAAVPEAVPALSEAYPAPEFEYMAVLTLSEAIDQLAQPYDLIACSVHFNDGQFYDFLRMAKAHPVARDIPFLVHFTGLENKRHYVSQSVEIASKALGASEVIPIYQWRNELGNEPAFKKYREVIRRWVGR